MKRIAIFPFRNDMLIYIEIRQLVYRGRHGKDLKWFQKFKPLSRRGMIALFRFVKDDVGNIHYEPRMIAAPPRVRELLTPVRHKISR